MQINFRTIFFSFISLLLAGRAHSQDCPENINKLPMYGHVKKCKEQIKFDKDFLAECDKSGKSRKESAQQLVMRGWQYLYAKNLDTSMMRFNQAWLLDSLNADIYWGFGNLLGMQGKFKESIPLFERSIKINPGNAKVWHDESITYGNVFFATNNIKYLNSAIYSLKTAISLDQNNPQFYGELTAAYTYFMQKDSARKYLKITEHLDPNAVNPQVKKMLVNK